MSELIPLLASAVILGLLGGGHCLGMCGGLMGAMTMAIPATEQNRRLQLLLTYNLGRILSYGLAGLLIGQLADWSQAGSNLTVVLRTLSGLLLISMGLYLAGWWNGLTYIEKTGRLLWRLLAPIARSLLPVRTATQALMLGIIWGWLPCGLVYSTLLWAASQGDAITAAVLMAGFGLGTLPVLIATGMAAERMTRMMRRHGVRMAGGVLVILFGIWTIPGPHQSWLMGHPPATHSHTPL